MKTARAALALLLALCGPAASAPALAGDKAAAIEEELAKDDYEGARKKCEKWEASGPAADAALKDACAEAFWPLAEAQDTTGGWQIYRKTWAGTDWAEEGFQREAAAALRELGEAPEDDLLEIVRRYPDTRAAAEAQEMAGDAAIRDVSDGDAAVRAAERYPGHPGLPALVERYPDRFLTLAVQGQKVDVTVEPPVKLTGYLQPQVVWVARWPGGQIQPWAETATAHLLEAGLLEEQIRGAVRPADQGSPLPLCALPGQPPGLRAAIEVQVGAGRVYQEVPWEAGCGPTDLPVVLTVEGGQVAGLSLRPGQRVDLASRQHAGRDHARAYAPAAAGDLLLAGGRVYLPAGSIFVVYPLDGGPPWLTDKAPPREGRAALSAGIKGSGPPAGLSVAPQGADLALTGSALSGQPIWLLPRGEVRFLSPLVQQVLGISRTAPVPSPGAPALTAATPWTRDGGGAVQNKPPAGAEALPLAPATEAELQAAALRAASAGIDLADLVVLDGYSISVDADPEPEILLRALLKGQGAVLALDIHPQLGNRLFVFSSPTAARGKVAGPPPFAFRLGGHAYVAWTGAAHTRASYVEVVRFSGESFSVEGIEVPR